MAVEFSVKFIGHIDERRRSENFPRDIVTIGTYRVENNKQIADVVNEELKQFIMVGGMIVSLDPAQTIDTRKLTTDNRFYVPMHMIAYIRTEVSMTAPMPQLVDTGVLDKEGNPIQEFQTPDGERIRPS